MEEILQLLSMKSFCFLCKQIFLHQLPTVVHTQLAEANFSSDPRAVANQATTLWHTTHLENQLVGKISGIISLNNELCIITKPNTLSTVLTIHKNWCQFYCRFGKAARKCQKPCSFPGNATASHHLVPSNSVLLYASDILPSCHFLIDMGTEVSIFPAFSTDCIDTTGLTLVAANGTCICTFGKHNLKFHIGWQPFSWDFLLADIPQPLLRADFLCTHALMVDIAGKCLYDTHKLSMTPLVTTSVQPAYLQLSAVMTPSQFQAVLGEFPQLTQPNFSATKHTHGVSHFILTLHCR